MYKSLIVSVLASSVCLLACNENKKQEAVAKNEFKAITSQKPFINPPVTDLIPQYVSFTLDASKGTTFRLKNGSEIVVPADAFTDENGQILRGTIEMKYREMHNALSIYLAGVPMNYKNGHFTTAGTFDLRAFQQNKNIQLQRPLKVKMASYTCLPTRQAEEDDYDFFYLNENERRWDSLGHRKPEVNVEKQRLLKSIENQRFTQRFPLDRQYFAFNYMAIMDVYYNDDWRILSKQKTIDSAFTAITSKLESYGLGWENNYCNNRKMITWQQTEYPAPLFVWKNVHKKPFPDWAKGAYGSLKDLGKNHYMYSVENEKDSTRFEVELECVMPLKSLFAFSPDEWKNQYAATMQKVKKEQERLKQIADVYRTFEINKLGLYNWDKLMKDDNAVVLEANFEFPSAVNEKLTTLDVVYISGDNRSVITFPKISWDKLAIVPDDGGRLFVIMPDNKVALYSVPKYSKLEFATWRASKTPPQYMFKLEEKTNIKTEADLKRILQI